MAGVKLNRRPNISSTERVGQELGRVCFFFCFSCDCSGWSGADLSDFGGQLSDTDTGALARTHTHATFEVRKFLSQLGAMALIPSPVAGWRGRVAERLAAAHRGGGRDVGCRCCATWSWPRPRRPRGLCPCCCWRQ